MSMLSIDITGLTKIFDNKIVVNNLDIKVEKGKIIGFLGPNGSGKTTTMRMICGLLTPDSGNGTCLGFNIRTQVEDIKRRIGYMTQKFSFWEDLSIYENLLFVAKIYGMNNIKARVDKAIEDLNLKNNKHQLTGQLSGGWKQRLALAACILHEPELLILDEPTAGVDPKARREFWNEVHELADKGITVLVSTHYMDEAERCHKIIYMSNGFLVAQGSVNDVIKGAGLTTWVVQGDKLIDLAKALENKPGINSIAPFGNSLHISGIDKNKLEQTLKPYFEQKEFTWHKEKPSFEDIFIRYMIDDIPNKENK